MSDILQKIVDDVAKAYKSTSSPNFSSIGKGFSYGINYEEIKSISCKFWIKDVTEQNDEYCFSFLVRSDLILFRLELSIVGPYAVLMVVDGDKCQLFSDEDISQGGDVLSAFAELMRTRKFLGQLILESRIFLNTDDAGPDGKVAIYNALFASTERLPWDAGATRSPAPMN